MTRLFLDANIVIDLLERREPFCHDAVRLFTKVDVIITRNGKDFAASKIPVMTATEYLASIE